MRPNEGRSSGHGGLSSKQIRALRKERLTTRASVERMAIREAKADLAHKMSRFGWLGLLLPGFAHRADVGSGEKMLSALPSFLRPWLQAWVPMLRRHPLYSALLSFVLPGTNRTEGDTRGAGAPAKWAGALVLGIKIIGFWRRFQGGRKSRHRRK